MAENAVAPWRGELEWVDEPREGRSKNGTVWKSVNFALKYQDHQLQEKIMVFSAFGAGRVDKLLGMPKGTELKVVWEPEANQSRDGRYFPSNSVISIGIEKKIESADTKIKAPNFPEYPPMQDTLLPNGSPSYAPLPSSREDAWKNPMTPPSRSEGYMPSPLDGSDLPFNQSPVV